MIKKRTRQRPQPSWDIYFSDSSMCPLSKNEWSLKKKVSLWIIYSHVNSLLPRKWTLKRREQQTVHNLFLYLTDTEKRDGGGKKDKILKKHEKHTAERGGDVERSYLTGCNVHMCIHVQLTVIFRGRTNMGFHKLYFYTQNCKLDFDRSLPNHISLFEIV